MQRNYFLFFYARKKVIYLSIFAQTTLFCAIFVWLISSFRKIHVAMDKFLLILQIFLDAF